MFGYVGLVYACLFDFFIFNDAMNWLEWVGAIVIMLTVISLTIYLLFKKKEDEEEKPETTAKQ